MRLLFYHFVRITYASISSPLGGMPLSVYALHLNFYSKNSTQNSEGSSQNNLNTNLNKQLH